MAKSTAQPRQPDTAQPETSVIGLPIYDSDGTKIGEATQVGMHEGQQSIAAQLEPSLMAAMVIIPAKMMTQQGDRLDFRSPPSKSELSFLRSSPTRLWRQTPRVPTGSAGATVNCAR